MLNRNGRDVEEEGEPKELKIVANGSFIGISPNPSNNWQQFSLFTSSDLSIILSYFFYVHTKECLYYEETLLETKERT